MLAWLDFERIYIGVLLTNGVITVFKNTVQFTALLFCLSVSNLSVAATTIVNTHPCTIKNLDVKCDNGKNIKVDVIRSTDERGEVFLSINAPGAIGSYLLLYINDNKPEVLKVENGTNTVQVSKGAFIPQNTILKLKDATSVHFKIAMKQGSPLSGNLDQNHFDWLKRFGDICR